MQFRDLMQIPARLIQAIFLSLVVGLIYLQVLASSRTGALSLKESHDEPCSQLGDDQESISDRQGSLFFVVMSLALGPLMGSLLAFQAERVVFLRERSQGSYNTLTYYLAKVIAELPWLIVFPALQGLITYFMVALARILDPWCCVC